MADGEGLWDEIIAAEESAAPPPVLGQSLFDPMAIDMDPNSIISHNTELADENEQRGTKRKIGDEDGDNYEVDEDDEDEENDQEDENNENNEDNNEDNDEDEVMGNITGRVLSADVRRPPRPQRKRARNEFAEKLLSLVDRESQAALKPIKITKDTNLNSLNKHFTIKEAAIPKAYNAKVPLNSNLDQTLVIHHILTEPRLFADTRPRVFVPSSSTKKEGSGSSDAFSTSLETPLPPWFKREEISREEKLAFDALTDKSVDVPATAPSDATIPVKEKTEFSFTAQSYLEMRNAIVKLYESDPKTPLSISRCAREVGGDISEVFRVYQFLVHWGIINNRSGPLLSDDWSRLKPFMAASNSLSDIKNEEVKSETKKEDPLSYLRNDFLRPTFPPPLSSVEYGTEVTHTKDGKDIHCAVTGRSLNGSVRYQCVKAPHVFISPEAFAAGTYPSIYFSSDFVRIDDAVSDTEILLDESSWSTEETLRLLEAVEQCGERWADVAVMVGGRTARECLEHFIRMPVEEILMSASNMQTEAKVKTEVKTEGEVPSSASAEAALEPIEAHALYPLMSTPNPIVALIVFLQRLLSPEIAAVAAQAAMHSLMISKDSRVKSETEPTETSELVPTDSELLVAYSKAIEAARKRALYLIQKEESHILSSVATALASQKQKLQFLYENLQALEKQLQEEEIKVDTAKAAMKKDEERIEASIKALSQLIPAVTPTKLNKSTEVQKAKSVTNTSEKPQEEKKDEKGAAKDDKEKEKAAEGEKAEEDEEMMDEDFELDPELEKALNLIDTEPEEKAQGADEDAVALPDTSKPAAKMEEMADEPEEEEVDEGEDRMDVDEDK